MAEIERIVAADVDPAAVAAGAVANVDVNVAGLNLGYSVVAFPPVDLEAGLVPQAVDVVDTGAGALRIRQRIYNPSAAAVDGISRRWRWGLIPEGG